MHALCIVSTFLISAEIIGPLWCHYWSCGRGGRANKKFNAQAQTAQPKFLIGETQAQNAQVKIKSKKRKRKLRNFFQKFNKAQAQNAQYLKKWIKRKLSNISKQKNYKSLLFWESVSSLRWVRGTCSNRIQLWSLLWAILICWFTENSTHL